MDMARVVVQYINDNGGLNGHPIQLFTADSKSDPDRYFSLVKRMVEQDGVIAFLGQAAPLTANAADQYLRDQGIPVVGGEGAHITWFQSPVHFFAGPSYTTMAVANAKIASQRGNPKIGLIYCSEAQPCQMYRDALHSPLMDKADDAEVVYEAEVSLAQPDFTAECLQARDAGAETVFAIIDANAAQRLTRSCSQQGYNPEYAGSPLTLTNAVRDDPNLDGMYEAVATFPWFADDFPAAQEYQQAVQQYNPDLALSGVTSTTWVAGQMLLEATKDLPANNPTAQDIFEGMWRIQDNDFGGLVSSPVSFARGEPSTDDNCYFFVQLKNKEYTAPDGTEPAGCL